MELAFWMDSNTSINGRKEEEATLAMGRRAGYVFSYLVFTGMLYLALSLTGRLPSGFGPAHVFAITLGIVLLSALLKRLFI